MDENEQFESTKPANPFQAPATPFKSSETDGEFVNLQELAGTRRGLKLVYWGMVMILLGFVVAFLGAFSSGVFAAYPSTAVERLWMLAILFCSGAIILGGILFLTGQGFCLAVPYQSGARGLIQTVVVLNVLILFGAIVAAFSEIGQREMDTVTQTDQWFDLLVNLATSIASLVSFYCFLVFLKRVARYSNQRKRMTQATRVVQWITAAIVLYLGFILWAIFLVGGGGPPEFGWQFFMAAIILTLVWLVSFCKFANLVQRIATGLNPNTK